MGWREWADAQLDSGSYPDDDVERPVKPCPNPTTYVVEWFAYDERFGCVVPMGRSFDGHSHGSEALAWKAAKRYLDYMNRKLGEGTAHIRMPDWGD